MEQDLFNADDYFPRDFDPEWFIMAPPAGPGNMFRVNTVGWPPMMANYDLRGDIPVRKNI
jgi:hypothetical protein